MNPRYFVLRPLISFMSFANLQLYLHAGDIRSWWKCKQLKCCLRRLREKQLLPPNFKCKERRFF